VIVLRPTAPWLAILEDTGFGCKRGEIMWAPLNTMDLENILFQDRIETPQI
jgi:hypothetical protein